jgi:hypothetical protein
MCAAPRSRSSAAPSRRYYEGASQIQQVVIARETLKRGG